MNIRNAIILVALIAVTSSCQESKRERVERESKRFTERECPKSVSPENNVILDSLVFHDVEGNNDYIYYYTVDADEEGLANLDEHKEEMRSAILTSIRNSVELKGVKEMGLTLVYKYYNKADGKLVLEYTFTKEEYAN